MATLAPTLGAPLAAYSRESGKENKCLVTFLQAGIKSFHKSLNCSRLLRSPFYLVRADILKPLVCKPVQKNCKQ